ncbi:FG-GAP-like repeat-containing protein [Paracraurococcus ruber]|uniref:Calcium-binding protein n=1 Tax=Paracraurococcus ruber TaxID=77675 RepID=A0ABS1D0G3_9PROT|nr:FG-GAP-like repeat-containing protein [Paracraurococcus ruber]MBK1660190.1 hypothetical protein [Paracraurococcus ruber]TDG28345.1 hypothetical protein E2C05_20740 [Paracraurococcus ruber]
MATFAGAPGNDTFSGTADADRAQGFGGADTLSGLGGNDTLWGGNSVQGAGADAADGGDLLDGGDGVDEVFGQGGNDTLTGGPGKDLLNGGLGTDLADYLDNADTRRILAAVIGGQITVDDGLGGTDTLLGIEAIRGGAGNDGIALAGLTGAFRLEGSGGDDTLVGGAGADTLIGGAGDDSLAGGAGSGPDTADYSGNAAAQPIGLVVVGGALRGDDGLGGQDALDGIEAILATPGDDTLNAAGYSAAGLVLQGNGGDDAITGGSGADTLPGGEGNDTLAPGAGSDLVDGEGGIDLVSYAGNAASQPVNLGSLGGILRGTDGLGGSDTLLGIEILELGAGNDSVAAGGLGTAIEIRGGGGGDFIFGSTFDDTLIGGAGNDSLGGQGGRDVASYVFNTAEQPISLSFSGSPAFYRVNDGQGGIDTLTDIEVVLGGAGNDSLAITTGPTIELQGGEGADTLAGAAANDTLRGGAGDDSLLPGAGDDLVDGGPGIDTVSYAGVTGGQPVRLLAVVAPVGGAIQLSGPDGQGGIDVIRNVEVIIGGRFDDLVDARLIQASQTLIGGGGDDILQGGIFADMLVGGTGDDVLIGAFDTASYADNGFGQAIGLTAAGPYLIVADGLGGTDILDGITTVTGGAGNDRMDATGLVRPGPSAPSAGDPNDLGLSGGGGNDSLRGSGGRDTLAGGSGNDTLAGGAAADLLAGNDNNDLLLIGTGQDTLDGGAGDDTASFGDSGPGQGVTARLSGTPGDLLLEHGPGFGTTARLLGVEAVAGGGGDDSLFAAAAGLAVDLAGGGGKDTLVGGSGLDSLDGGDGNDSLVGGARFDLLVGGEGDDTLQPGGEGGSGDGLDFVFGGPGFDTATYAGNGASQRITLSTAGSSPTRLVVADAGSQDDLNGIEAVVGGAGNDTLFAADYGAALSLDGGGGDDSVIGTRLGDTLAGGAGNDTISAGSPGSLGDLVLGGAGRDVFLALRSAAGAVLARLPDGGWTLDAVGGGQTTTLRGVEILRFFDADVALGTPPRRDFGGDGIDEILWRSSEGWVWQWQMQAGQVAGGGGTLLDPGWTVQGTGDFDLDGRADLLWRYGDGTVWLWTMAGAQVTGGGFVAQLDLAWSIRAVADLTGDGRADILWQNTAGDLAVFAMNGTAVVGGGGIAGPGAPWSFAAAADLSGDGRADILWRNAATGGFVAWAMDGTSVLAAVDLGAETAGGLTDWALAGTGDFDGDGRADLLLRSAGTGALVLWDLQPGLARTSLYVGAPGPDWSVAAIGDHTGDGRADILFRGAAGGLALWTMQGATVLAVTALADPGAAWQVVG